MSTKHLGLLKIELSYNLVKEDSGTWSAYNCVRLVAKSDSLEGLIGHLKELVETSIGENADYSFGSPLKVTRELMKELA